MQSHVLTTVGMWEGVLYWAAGILSHIHVVCSDIISSVEYVFQFDEALEKNLC